MTEAIFDRASKTIPGGVNSPVRAFKGVDGTPLFFKQGKGAYLIDIEDRSYIDYIGSWGPLILGHCYPSVVHAIQEAASKGLSFGAPTLQEVLLAEKICDLMPNIEQVRLVNSGTEAAMSALRLARGYTQRSKIIKFIGCYHGHADVLLVAAGSGILTCGIPGSSGIPASMVEHTLLADYNDLDSVEALFKHYGTDIAAVIVEPVAANMNCILPVPGFLTGLRSLCDHYESLLIFDEVITGFRISLGGAQALYQVKPDLTILGKIIGGGMPVGAFGGRRDIMQYIAPLGPVYQAGTLSGNPLATAAGLTTLTELCKPGFYENLSQKTRQLTESLTTLAKQANIPFSTNAIGGLFGLFFSQQDITTITQQKHVDACHHQQFKQFFHLMLKEGIYLAPSVYEAGFMSAAHGNTEITATLLAAEKSFAKLSRIS